jgi:hypothetical protein
MPISPNPLARRGVIDGAGRRDRTPIPLASERMRVVIRDNLALVSREQTFRNSEERSIEATLTFPVPIHATLHRLVAKIGERTLTGSAMPRAKARHAYEKAVDDGRTAVLHEELVRGIHMLSIAHIPPGSEVKVTHSWISAMSPRGAGKAVLRVPVNLGDVYGDSPFSDADDLSTSPEVIHEADVEIDARAFTASIRGVPVVDSTIRLRLDAPIGVEVNGFSNTPAHGVSADGRSVQVLVVPDRGGDAAIDAAILVDRSGSMGDAASSKQPGLTKHAAIAAGLVDVARALRPTDRAELWQFDNSCERLSDPEEPLIAAVSRLDEPRGGTEIGAALKSVVAGCEARDIVLITDGLSHALDVQTLVNSGHRFTVVLVGEDSLEANVGRLAAAFRRADRFGDRWCGCHCRGRHGARIRATTKTLLRSPNLAARPRGDPRRRRRHRGVLGGSSCGAYRAGIRNRRRRSGGGDRSPVAPRRRGDQGGGGPSDSLSPDEPGAGG